MNQELKEKRELKEKLGRWASFKQSERFPQKDYHFERGQKVANWLQPSGLTSFGPHDIMGMLPDFTGSLDACFQWLVPEMMSQQWKVRLAWSGFPPGKPRVHLCNWDRKFNRQTRPQIAASAETPALALCKAIEQYIDKQGDK